MGWGDGDDDGSGDDHCDANADLASDERNDEHVCAIMPNSAAVQQESCPPDGEHDRKGMRARPPATAATTTAASVAIGEATPTTACAQCARSDDVVLTQGTDFEWYCAVLAQLVW